MHINGRKILIGFIILQILLLPIFLIAAKKQQETRGRAAITRDHMILGISLPYGRASKDINTDSAIAEIEKFASPVSSGGVGKYPASYSIWTDFSEGNWRYGSRSKFPNQKLLNYLHSKGITPMIFMIPVGPDMTRNGGTQQSAQKYSNQSIANGSFDAYFIEWANEAKTYGKPVILRYAWEMNGNWFPWSPYNANVNGLNYYDVGNTPENYVTAWRHIYNLIKPIAPNVKFFWCPGGNEGGVTYMKRFYPGKSYVDYVGFDTYNWNPARTTNNPALSSVYAGPIGNIREVVTGSRTSLSTKPIIVGETGLLVNNTLRAEKLDFGAIYNTYPDLSGIIYFDVDVNYLFGVSAEPGINWRLSGKSDNPAVTTQGVDLRPKYGNFAAQAKFMGKFNPEYESNPATVNTPTPVLSQIISPTKTLTPTPKPTLTPSPTPTKKPTPTPTRIITPTPTRIPTGTPTPTISAGTTALKFASVKLHGIGKGGDNTNPISLGNQNPLTTTRLLNIEIFNSSGNLVNSSQGDITYNNTTGDFSGNIILPTNFPTGSYTVKAKSNKYLKRQLTEIITINNGSTNQAPALTLITGDVNSDNQLNILDFNILMDCYSDLLPAKNCSDPAKKTQADLSDDGKVNYDDYTLFLRELSVVTGD